MEKEKDVIEIIVDEPLHARTDDETKSDSSDLSARFVKISCAVCVGVLLIAFAAGLILSKSEGMITKQLEVMRERNDEYAQAKERNDSAVLENDNAKKRLEDKEKELDRLGKEKKRLESEIKRAEGKLSNKGFTEKAPAKVVEEERKKAEKYSEMLKTVLDSIEKLK